MDLFDSTSNYVKIAGVQLEIGSTATEFEHLPYQVELARCQRYLMKWWNHGGGTNNHSRFPPGYYQNANTGVFYLFHSVPMRRTDGRALSHNISLIENMTGGGNNNNLQIMSDGNSNMITAIQMTGLSGVTPYALFAARVAQGQTDWYILVASEI